MVVDTRQHTDRNPPVTDAIGTIRSEEFVNAAVAPHGSLGRLSQQEIEQLLDRGQKGLYSLFRRCALAILNAGSPTDDPTELLSKYASFEIRILREASGISLEVENAPAHAFVDGQMIRGIREHLFAVLRDIVYVANEIMESGRFDLHDAVGISNAVFCILRNAGIIASDNRVDLVVCWGGHSISRSEYEYTKLVGYELGLRSLNVCTGCGPGAMKGPMKGATIGHAKQRIHGGRYIGISEPGILAAESPNPIVNHLVIMPDIEKRLEAFVRLAHGIVVFPGGPGTAEELLYLLGILLEPANAAQNLPLVLTGPQGSADWLSRIDTFIGLTLGVATQEKYRIIINDPAEVARTMNSAMHCADAEFRSASESCHFNWTLKIPADFQQPFEVTHENVAALNLTRDQPLHLLAANLRRAFSAVVSGNIKEHGIHQIVAKGPFQIHGESDLMRALDDLLASFVAEGRMKLSGVYRPVYRVMV